MANFSNLGYRSPSNIYLPSALPLVIAVGDEQGDRHARCTHLAVGVTEG